MGLPHQSEPSPAPQQMPGPGKPTRRLWQRLGHWFRVNTFTPAWLGPPWGHPLVGICVAILSQLIVVGLRQLLVQIFPQAASYNVLSILSVAIIALSWGAGPSIISMLLGATFLAVVILPTNPTPPDTESMVVSAVIYLLAGFAISALATQTERARRNAQTLAASLEQERARLEATFAAIADGVIVYNPQGHILHLNPAGQRLLARLVPVNTVLSPNAETDGWVGAIRDERGSPLAEDDWPQFRILRGETLTGSSAPDVRVALRDGGEVELNASGAPIRDQTGKVAGIVCLYRDVTERRRLERRTQEGLEALLLMAEALVQVPPAPPDEEADLHPTLDEAAQRLVEMTQRVLGCQRVSIAALEPETDLQMPIAAIGLTPEEEAFLWDEEHRTRLGAGPDPSMAPRLRVGEIVIVNTAEPPYQGRPNPYNVQTLLVAPIRIGERLIGVLGLDYGSATHAFTKEEIALTGAVCQLGALVLERERMLRERAEAQAKMLALQETNERMDQFLSIISHELRTPVTSIKTGVQLLLRRIAGPTATDETKPDQLRKLLQDQERGLQRTDVQVRRLTHLLDDLIDLARIRTGKLEILTEMCNLGTLVREVVEEEQITHHDRTISLELAAGPPIYAQADPNRIGQVLTNYLTNALKYSSPDQPVHVGLAVEGQQARVWVTDKGPGIPPAEQPHIWELFHRVPGIEVKSGSGIGLGLGLHISRTMIMQHHGNVGVESVPGEGSTFWFTLPLASAVEAANQGD